MDFYLAMHPSFKTDFGILPTSDQSFLRGAIDLIFESEGLYYLADWKSNHLRPDYGWQHLNLEMTKERYILQAEIYTLAFLSFAESALPNFDLAKQFGGVLYLFLRGMRGEPGTGVFHLYPAGLKPHEIEALRSRVLKQMQGLDPARQANGTEPRLK